MNKTAEENLYQSDDRFTHKMLRPLIQKRRFPKAPYFLHLAIIVAVLMISVQGAEAYIGPGAGFAFLSSFLILIVTFALVLFYLFSWPFRFAINYISGRARKRTGKGTVQRVVVIGLDGMDPELTRKYMEEGLLPHFKRLKESGTFSSLSTTYPSISPVAWSSFMTGTDAAHHNIYDFITRDPCTYMPMLSSAEIQQAKRVLPLGKFLIPLGKPRIKLFRKSKPFWKILGENGIFSSVIRVPVTFPPEKFKGVLLSGMCVPDLRGSQGTFTFFTTGDYGTKDKMGGVFSRVVREGDTIRTHLTGPRDGFIKGGGEMKIPVAIQIDRANQKARIRVCGQVIDLRPETYSPWIKVFFRSGLGTKVHGICLFYLNRITPEFELYVSPIHIDPEKPALPISYPFIYSIYLSKLIGSYGTLGLAEDTWALNEGALNEEAFLKQSYLFFEERKKMFFEALDRTHDGLCTCVFDITDRVQHMFFRYLNEHHPANRGKDTLNHKDVIPELYREMDRLLGKTLSKIDDRTVLIVMSDHGFTQFQRGVNLNSWLFQNGYLALKGNQTESASWLSDVDWKRTRAYSLGLAGVFINRKGREASGTVEEGEEHRALKNELISKLAGLADEERGEVAIREVVDSEECFSGPYAYDAPDLLVGYNGGYRSSWECVTGRVTRSVFVDNTKHWSGDHCVAPGLVPGILFVNRKLCSEKPNIMDIAPSILRLFGVKIPPYMKGKPIIDGAVKGGVGNR